MHDEIQSLNHNAYMVENCVNEYRAAKNRNDELAWLKDLTFFSAELRAYTLLLIEELEKKDDKD